MKKLIERTYDVGEQRDAALLVIYEPYLEDGDWTCVHSFALAGDVREDRVRGVDKLQALALSLKKIAADLDHMNRQGARVTWMGNEKLDLI